MVRILFALSLLAAWCGGAEFHLLDKDKTLVTCDEIVLSKETPRAFVTAKSAKETKSFKYSEVDVATLPAAMQAEFAAFKAEQLTHRLILKDDKWVSRNELLLKEDKTYGYKRALARIGDSVLEFKNDTKDTITIGVRSGDTGYEMHLEAGRKKAYQVPDGSIHYYMASESADGKRLIIQKSKVQEMKRLHLTVTVTTSDEVPADELGAIEIPPEYQVPQQP